MFDGWFKMEVAISPAGLVLVLQGKACLNLWPKGGGEN